MTALDMASPLLETKLYVPKLRRGVVVVGAQVVHRRQHFVVGLAEPEHEAALGHEVGSDFFHPTEHGE